MLGGKAEIEGGYARDTETRDNGKELALSVLEVLDKVRRTLPALHQLLRREKVLNSPLCPHDLRKECLVALPTLCVTYGMLPSRYLPAGHLIVDHQSTICVGGADVRCGTLDGLTVTVKSIQCNLTESLNKSQEVS